MSISLYQLSGEYYQALADLTDPENDYPVQAVVDTLDSLGGELQDKSINVAKFIRHLETQAEAIKQAETEMARRRKTLEAHAIGLKAYLKSSMELTGITKIECPYFKLSIAKNPASLDLFDELAIPDEFKRTETVTVIDKAAIKAAIIAGHEVTGARVTNGTRLVIK
jgi:hypothetical protein